MNLSNKKVLITGASFIGVHLIQKLISENVLSISVINLSNKHRKNLLPLLNEISYYTCDLRDFNKTKKLIRGYDVVFHLAADHGGRGYVSLRQSNTATNFLLDGSVFKACLENGVEKIFFASSGCVYPNYMQTNTHKNVYLKETDVSPPYDADNMYGWAKLMGELTLHNYYKDYGLKSAIGRFFTVYGPHASESHAVMGTISKAFIKQDPFIVWGNGKQIRNWTYVDDIVDGIIKSVKKIDDACPINLGTNERISVQTMVKSVLSYMKHKPKSIIYNESMPSGPVNRVANIDKANRELKWIPKYTFNEGLKKTIDWYIRTHNVKNVSANLERILI